MSAPARRPAAQPSPRAVFIARAEARATLWQSGEIDLHSAIDELQAAAVASGLVEQLGQDAVQQLLVEAFAPVRAGDDDKVPDDIASERTDPRPRQKHVRIEAAASTVEALLFDLRERGSAALTDPRSLQRLAELSSRQVREVINRLTALRARYPKITAELLFILEDQLQ